MPDQVLLIGGASSVGKTTVARALATRLAIPHLQTDIVLHGADPTLDPLAGPIDLWDQPPAHLCQLLVLAAEAAIPPLERQVATCPSAAILEGERIHPRLIQRQQGRARGVLIIESDAQRLYQTLMGRSRGFAEISEARRRAVAEVDRLYGCWLVAEAARCHVACVDSQPWATLADRVLATFR